MVRRLETSISRSVSIFGNVICRNMNPVITNSLPTWISEGARMAVMGDAAHPFLPYDP
jgi:hypothetical protein